MPEKPGPLTLLKFVPVILLIGVVLFSQKVSDLYTEWLWFQSAGYEGVFATLLKTKVLLGVASGLFLALFLQLNFWLAGRERRSPLVILADVLPGLRQREQWLFLIRRIAPWVFVLVGLVAAQFFSSQWSDFLSFLHGKKFNQVDPLFGRDLSFYVFRLPVLEQLQGFLLLSLLLAALVAVGTYSLRGDVDLNLPRRRLEIVPEARLHLGALAAGFFALKGWGYFLERFDLLCSQRGAVFGATYADVHVRIPVLTVLSVLAALFAVASCVSMIRESRTGVLTIGILLATLLGTSFAAGVAYPGLVQRYRVAPNEIVLETPYIDSNIRMTRQAYGLQGITEKPFDAMTELTPAILDRNQDTVDNIRLWDHRPLLSTFSQLQEIRTYYRFLGVDNDRYWIGGRYRQVMLSLRELDPEKLPSRIWINEHLTYTHGYGLVMGPVNEATPEGLPRLFIQDLPPASTVGMTVKKPAIYYGEAANEYAVVNTASQEFDYPSGDENVYSSYAGKGGVALSGFFRKLAFAQRFGTLKLLLSQDVTPKSRILFYRDIRERVSKVTPKIVYDTDPYPVLADGNIYWILDGYTFSDNYPYSQPFSGKLNYIRNSVKAVVNAYDGEMEFFVNDPQDPILQTYAAVFPGVFKPLQEMPEALRSHLRYPRDLFEIQGKMYGRYHMTDPRVFYNQEDLWTTPHEIIEGEEVLMEPYYTIMRLPGSSKPEYILMQPFTPSKRDNMISWMAGRSDPPHTGELLVFRFPKERLVYGPMQIEARISQNSEISQQFTLWGQLGTRVMRGNLLVIPIENSLLYVEPVFLQAERSKIPELRRVIAAFGERISMSPSLPETLQALFSGWTPPRASKTQEIGSQPQRSVQSLTQEAWRLLQEARRFQERGDWAGYGSALHQLEEALKSLKSIVSR